jgi:hypothetical protein
MEEKRNAHRVLMRRSERKRPLGRFRRRWVKDKGKGKGKGKGKAIPITDREGS